MRLVLCWAEQPEPHLAAGSGKPSPMSSTRPRALFCLLSSKLAGRKSEADESHGRGYNEEQRGSSHRKTVGLRQPE